ncbi:ABC transporter permease [Candidatus Gracilibacteria bacterium]|nr:ABC transporter permease [Candidatus Gracilibacteria bacterium]
MFNIAINTFKEIVRNKFLYLILVFGFLFIVFSISLGKLTIGEDSKVITDFGIAMIEIFGLIGVLFVGSQLLFKEIEGKTIFLILSKPIKRYEFILGKFLGFSLIILLITLLQSFLYLGVLFFNGITIEGIIIMSLIFILFKLWILIALVLFLSTFMSNILTIIVSILIYFTSHSFSLLLDLVNQAKILFLEVLVRLLQLLFPPFEALNTKDYIGSFSKFNTSFFIENTLYSILYLVLILFFTILIFNRKKFEN